MVNFKRNAKPIAAGQQQRKVKGFKPFKPPVTLGGGRKKK
jgi:hypothetical protein